MQNLREKLLKAGLVTADQAKQVEERKKSGESNRHRPAPERPRRSEAPPPHEARPDGRIPKLPPLPGSREHQRLISKQQLELDRRIRELVTASQVPVEPGEQTFYFVTRKGRLRRLELSAAQHGRLEKGELAVVERPDPGQIEHALVPTATAEKLLPLSERAVRFLNKEGSAVGFLTDEDLKKRQEAELSLPPETPSGEGDAERGDDASTQAPDPGDPSPSA